MGKVDSHLFGWNQNRNYFIGDTVDLKRKQPSLERNIRKFMFFFYSIV